MNKILPDRIKYTDYDYVNRSRIDEKIKANKKLNILDWTNSVPVQPNPERMKAYAFSEEYFTKLIHLHMYNEAADYAENFQFHDPKKQKEHENDIYNLRREGRRTESIFSKLDKDQKDAIMFYDNYSIFGGLDNIQNNKYTKEFNEIKSKLGNVYETNFWGIRTDKIKAEATDIELEFSKNNLDKFFNDSGLSEDDLTLADIKINKKSNGNSTIKFSKTNPLSNKILSSKLYKHKGDLYMSNDDIGIKYFDKDGNILSSGRVDRLVDDLREVVEKAKKEKDKIYNDVVSDKRNFTSTVGPALDENAEYINELRRSGQLTDTEYRQAIKANNNLLEQAINTLGTSHFEFYSNAYNDKNTDFTLVKMSDTQRAELLNSLSAAESTNIYLNSMISNGKIGTLITIKAKEDKKNISDDTDDINSVKRRRRMIFIPGLFAELAQEKINRNTSFRAEQEINDMQLYRYSYKTKDGKEIRVGEDGTCYLRNSSKNQYYAVPRKEISRLIDKDMAVVDAKNIKYQFMNSDGKIFDKEGYEKAIKKYSIELANSLFPDILFEPNETIDDVFAKKGIGPVMAEEYANKTQYDLKQKYDTVFEIYNELIKEVQAQLK